jgi:hypothetical protein
VTCLFTLLDVVLLTNVVGDRSAACSNSSSNECAFTASGESTDDGTPCGRTSNDLGTCVVAMVAASLGAFGGTVFVVRSLGHQWSEAYCKHGCGNEGCAFHWSLLLLQRFGCCGFDW